MLKPGVSDLKYPDIMSKIVGGYPDRHSVSCLLVRTRALEWPKQLSPIRRWILRLIDA